MFGINFSEIVLICAVALVVLGPKQLPAIASKFGVFIYTIKNYISNFKQEIYYQSGAHEIINTKNEIIKTYANIRKNIMPHNKIDDYTQIPNNALNIEPYQPELDFDRQPELFDHIALTRKSNE